MLIQSPYIYGTEAWVVCSDVCEIVDEMILVNGACLLKSVLSQLVEEVVEAQCHACFVGCGRSKP